MKLAVGQCLLGGRNPARPLGTYQPHLLSHFQAPKSCDQGVRGSQGPPEVMTAVSCRKTCPIVCFAVA